MNCCRPDTRARAVPTHRPGHSLEEGSGGNVGPKTMQLLKAMREQLGDTSASRGVDAVAAAEALGMDTTTHDFDRRLQDLVRAGYLEPDPHSAAPAAQGRYRITFAGLDAADGY